MKSLLFIGAALMAGAGIYGFVDYRKKEQSKEFKTLYKEEKPVVQQSSPEIVTSPAPILVLKTNNAPGKKTKKARHKRMDYTLFSRQFSRGVPKVVLIEDTEVVEPPPPVKE